MILNKILIFIFVWISSFLIHELMHIKGQGLRTTGQIQVHEFGMTVYADIIDNLDWFYYSGGILTSFIMLGCVLLTSGWISWCFLTLMWVQLCYGIYEGYTWGNVKYRYYIYVSIVTVMMITWIVINYV